MSRLRIGKKLQPAKKAWKSFSNTVKSRLQKLNISKAIKSTLQKIITTFHTLCHIIASKGHNRSLTTIRRPYSSSSYGRNIPAIHIDELFSDPSFPSSSSSSSSSSYSSMHVNAKKSSYYAQGETSNKVKEVVVDKNREVNTIEDAWKAVVAKSPLLQVDEKAEEFISKFHQDMKLQKEKSLLEFQEMLARGV